MSRRQGKVFLVLFGAVLLVFAAVCGVRIAAVNGAYPAPMRQIGGLGDTVVYDGIALRLDGVRWASSEEIGEKLGEGAAFLSADRHLVADFTLTNVGETAKPTLSLTDPEGIMMKVQCGSYTNNFEGWDARDFTRLNGDFKAVLEPGESAPATVAFPFFEAYVPFAWDTLETQPVEIFVSLYPETVGFRYEGQS